MKAPSPPAVPTSPDAAAPSRETAWSVLVFATLLAIIPLLMLCQVIAVWRTDVVDDQMFGYYGWRIAHGATVYLDVWDNKPPGIYWINALGFLVGNDSYAGVVAMCVLALLVAHACFFIIAASLFFRGAAAIGTVLLSFYLTHGYYTGGTNRTETFLVACELAAVAFYMRGFAHPRWWKWLAVGMCCGGAFLFKQVGVAALGAMLLHMLVLCVANTLSWREGLRRVTWIIGGWALILAFAAGYLASQGALGDAVFATFTFNVAYFKAGASQFPYNYVTTHLLKEHIVGVPILLLPILLAAAGCIHALLWWARPKDRPLELEQQIHALGPVCPRYMLLFGVWLLASLYGAMLSPGAFRHYLVPTIPPLMLLATYFISMVKTELHLLKRMQQRAWVTGVFVLVAYFGATAVKIQWEEFGKIWTGRWLQGLKPGEPYVRAEWEAVGDAVVTITRPDDVIQCWGYMPGVYLRARRINAVRFTTTEKVGHVGGEADFVLRELEEGLATHPPAVIAVSATDYLWLNGRHPERKAPSVRLGRWLDEHYDRVIDVADFNVFVYKRKDLLTGDEKRRADALREQM